MFPCSLSAIVNPFEPPFVHPSEAWSIFPCSFSAESGEASWNKGWSFAVCLRDEEQELFLAYLIPKVITSSSNSWPNKICPFLYEEHGDWSLT